MKKITAVMFVSLMVPACITVRQSGAHDITVNTQGKGNSFTVHTERASSAQSAEATPIVDVKPTTELTVPVVP